jgi:membrane-associated protein
LPGGTALIVAGSLAASGDLNIALVCLIGASATILGANIGYLVGHQFGTKVLTMPGWLAKQRLRVLTTGERLVQRYGWLAVLFSRQFPVLRESAPLLVGSLKMTWRRFLLWNSVGGVVWVLTHALLGYFVGSVAGTGPGLGILLGLKIAVLILGGSIAYIRRRRAPAAP